jgi:hypothetical protein
MAKERSKDKGGTLNGQSKSANNYRSSTGKKKSAHDSSNRDLKNTGHIN